MKQGGRKGWREGKGEEGEGGGRGAYVSIS